MQYAQGSIASTLQNVQNFLATHADRLGALATSGARKKIDEIAASLDGHGREQEDRALAARMATARRVSAREVLIAAHMRPLALVAAAELANYGELAALHMPRLNVNDRALIQKARAMASAATSHEPAFSQGLAGDTFATDLEAAADVLMSALTERAAAVASRRKATAGLVTDTRTARHRLHVIDRLVTAVIKNDQSLLAEWNAAKQIAKKAGPPRVMVAPGDAAPRRRAS